jgi:tetratricopeptide (TPR) repeat protein
MSSRASCRTPSPSTTKILKNDAKDLTVTNTVGDLYSRLGETDKATECFKTVGDAYASQGFTVKAIAMYKKICKLQPSLESLLKLAELYSQQGLFNDARAQYLQVAEEFLKNGELDNSVRIFQKILEMDPENSNMRVRLAEVYIQLGKKSEAWQIFSAAAESLRSKGSLSGADEVLQRMLTLDPGNALTPAHAGQEPAGVRRRRRCRCHLAKSYADIDSNPDGLRDLLKAYLQTGQLSEAGTVANKLLTVHNDLPAIASFAEALMQAGQYETALQVYDEHAERLLAENSDKVLDSLHTIIGHVRDNPDSLQKLLDLFHKAGENTHVSEVIELLAHASVQAGDLPKARDLYQKLATVEPQNPLHMQNYQQVVSQLGGTSGSKLITPEEAVVLIDDLEATAPSVHQHYTDEIALAVRSALTDAELFISYNMPAKALGPLVGALPLAATDLRLNQRLAALHTRAGRFAEAALCCRTLQSVYSEAEYPEEASRYGELAERYEERMAAPAALAMGEEVEMSHGVSEEAVAEEAVSEEAVAVADDDVAQQFAVEEASGAGIAEAEVAAPWPTAAPADEVAASGEETPAAEAEEITAPEGESQTDEIDLSSEWEDSITVESDSPEATEEIAEPAPTADLPSDETINETVDEIRFYYAQGLTEQAWAALAKLQTQAPDDARVDQVRAELEAATQTAAEAETAHAEESIEEITVDDIPQAEVEEAVVPEADVSEVEVPEAEIAEAKPAEAKPVAAKPVAPKLATPRLATPKPVEAEPVEVELAEPEIAEPEIAEAEIPEPAAAVEIEEPAPVPEPEPEPEVVQAAVVQPKPEPPPIVKAAPAPPPKKKPVPKPAPAPEPELEEPAPAMLQEFVSDLESSLGDNFLPGAVAKPAELPRAQKPVRAAELELAPVAHAEPVVTGQQAPALRPQPKLHRLARMPESISPKCLASSNTIWKPTPRPLTRIPRRITTSASLSAKWACSMRPLENCKKPASPSITDIRSRRSCRPTPGWRNASSTKACPRPPSAGMTRRSPFPPSTAKPALPCITSWPPPTKPPETRLPPSSTSWTFTAATSTIATWPSALRA